MSKHISKDSVSCTHYGAQQGASSRLSPTSLACHLYSVISWQGLELLAWKVALNDLELHVTMASLMFVALAKTFHCLNVHIKIHLCLFISWVLYLRHMKWSANYHMDWDLHTAQHRSTLHGMICLIAADGNMTRVMSSQLHILPAHITKDVRQFLVI